MRTARWALVFLVGGLAGAWPGAAGAASTVSNEVLAAFGSGSQLGNGDYVSRNGAPGLNTFHTFFVEVPPGAPRLVVGLFDADVGSTEGGSNQNDFLLGGGWNTTARYTLRNPAGTVVVTLNATNTTASCPGCNNAWTDLYNVVSPAAGHWELRVDQSRAITAGDDLNTYGIRAHDGTAGAGGTELNIYSPTYVNTGVIGSSPGTGTTTVHPWVVSGCTTDMNDFDFDSAGSAVLSSRTTAFSRSITSVSGNATWRNTPVTGWTSDAAAADYGVWASRLTYSTPGAASGNFVTYYHGAFNAADPTTGSAGPPPSAQPEANTFRMYLQRDGGGAPAKPYFEQLRGYKSGPNPPVVGQTTLVTVTLRFVNPTPQAVTFSAANLVTANIPGTGATYGGNPQLTQGSVVAQPALGGTGTISWNPGTVAAGATVIFAYDVRVTPTSAGQRINLTGTPTANGSRAVYRDETGNTSQAQALATVGPLCQLVAQEAVITQALVTRFEARRTVRGVELEWETASEASTLGYAVRRVDERGRRLPLDVSVPTDPASPQGGVYRVLDAQAPSTTARLGYELVELEAGGTQQVYGPFWVVPRESVAPAGRALLGVAQRFERVARVNVSGAAIAARRVAHPPGRKTSYEPKASQRRPAIGPRPVAVAGALKLGVSVTGLYGVEATTLAEAWGVPVERVRRALATGGLSLSHRGTSISWRHDEASDALQFLGEAPTSPFTRDSVYWLRLSRGTVIAVDAREPAEARGVPSRVFSIVEREESRFAGTVAALDPDDDLWFWEVLAAGVPGYDSRIFDVDAPGALMDEGAALELVLYGASTTGLAEEHVVRVSVNEVEVGTLRWEGTGWRHEELSIPPGLLRAGANAVALESWLGAGVSHSYLYVDRFALRYAREATGLASQLVVEPAETNVRLELSNLARPLVLDVTTPARPIELTLHARDAVRNVEVHTALGARLLVVDRAAALAPRWLERDEPSQWRARANAVDYLIIAPRDWSAAASALADHQRARGLVTAVAYVDDVMDELNFGERSPHALAELLRRAATAWRVPPRYVALLGGGTFDHRDVQGRGLSPVPVLLARTPGGAFASDARFVPAHASMAIGRIPVWDEAQALAYVEKLARYEATSVDADPIFVADAPHGEMSFADYLEGLARGGATLPAQLALGSEGVTDARAQLFAALGRGPGTWMYAGHGGMDRLSAQGLLTVNDVPRLASAPAHALVALSCVMGRFEVPGFASLGPSLVTSKQGGAVVVIAPAGTVADEDARSFGESLWPRVVVGDRWGDVVREARAAHGARGGSVAGLATYNLLGDPSASVRVRGEPSAPLDAGGDM